MPFQICARLERIFIYEDTVTFIVFQSKSNRFLSLSFLVALNSRIVCRGRPFFPFDEILPVSIRFVKATAPIPSPLTLSLKLRLSYFTVGLFLVLFCNSHKYHGDLSHRKNFNLA